MKDLVIYNAKVVKLIISICCIFFLQTTSFAQKDDEKKMTGPIATEMEKQKDKDYLGSTLTPKEEEELTRIHEKYKHNDKEKAAKIKYQSRQPMTLMDNYRLGRANRKDYLKKKKLERFRRDHILNRQSPKMRERMIENEKRIKARDKNVNRRKKRKRFFNLFR